ncbi:MAG: DMT family transporter [Longimicrobiaceae bacterium]
MMVFIWGANFAVVKRALQVFEPLAFNALRFVIASALVYAVLRFTAGLGRPARADVPRIVLLGVVGNVAYQLCFILGLDRTRAGNAAVILALTPVLITLLSAARGHERPAPRAWLGVAVSVVGVAMVTGATPSLTRRELSGDLILVGATVVWAVYTVGLQPLIARYGSVRPTAWTLWVGATGLLLLGTPELLRQRWSDIDLVAWGGLLFSALLAIGLAYLLWYRGVERIGNTRTAVFSNVSPIVALLVASVWLGERPAPLQLAGVALVLGGVMLVRSGRSPRPVATARA